ncbi:WG repeat-containing protein [Flavobacterium sp. GN10]|uniref:WG repeat-containing protein n=1 Tax=Flavobacterium tagetis TaxID=2801336 RepID=A0ABS1K8E0_9FLAO|nr:WG repeat-containing protein [Flavobacterium tagetis]MBL0735462.1 WG repeat-containing protein [Flavobacterium tagetis]
MLYPIKRNNIYGFINEKGEIIIEPKFNYTRDFSNQVCVVSNNLQETNFEYDGKIYFYSTSTIINSNGDILFPFKKYLTIDKYSDDVAFCYNEKIKRHGVIDKNGEEIIPFIFSTSEIEYSLFSDGLARIKRDGKYGFINKNNEVVIPFDYDKASNFHNGYSLVKIKNKDFLINKNGEIYKTKHSVISAFYEDRAIVKLKNKYGFINKNNELVIDYLYDRIVGIFNEGHCLVKIGEKYGLINTSGETIIEFKFDEVRWIGNGVFPAKIGKKWTLINFKGEMKFEPKFEFINDFNKFNENIDYFDAKLTRAEFNKEDYYIDTYGNLISKIKTTEREVIYTELIELLCKSPEQKQVWDKAEWSYDGFSITKKGAIKPFYFILKWFKNNNLLTDEGIDAYNDKNNLEIGLYRSMFKKNAAGFLDYFYDYWYEKQHIANYQIDPDLKFEEDENIGKYWEFYKQNF